MEPAQGQHGRRSVAFARRLPSAGAAAGVLVTLAAGLSVLAGALGAQSPEEPADKPVDHATLLAPPTDFSAPESDEESPGGAATSRHAATRNAFSHFSATLTFAQQLDFKVGDGIFRKLWVSAPSSTTSSDGLGPLYNARSCQSCHLKDGRGHPAEGRWPDGDGTSMLFRVSVPPETDAERQAIEEGRQAVVPEPTYGTQLQGFAIQGQSPEVRVRITYEDRPVALHGGPVVHLQRPSYRATDLGYGPMRPEAVLSPRIAAPMIGLGLLEMVDEADILVHADPADRDGDGISGRPNHVWSMEHGRPMLGRFGWKAARATIRDQTAGAFSGDMGLSTELLPGSAGDCTQAQTLCRGAPNGADPPHGVEVAPTMFDSRLLRAEPRRPAAPARRRAGRAAREAGLLPDGMCDLPHAEVSDPGGSRAARAEPAAHLAVHGPPAPRHGAGTGRRPIGRPGHGPGMANPAALGHRLHGRRQRPHAISPRRPCAEPAGGDPLARRRGRGREAAGGSDDVRGARGIAGLPGLALIE
jgi:CxxC motif-containing protein (DUF1111 family)